MQKPSATMIAKGFYESTVDRSRKKLRRLVGRVEFKVYVVFILAGFHVATKLGRTVVSCGNRQTGACSEVGISVRVEVNGTAAASDLYFVLADNRSHRIGRENQFIHAISVGRRIRSPPSFDWYELNVDFGEGLSVPCDSSCDGSKFGINRCSAAEAARACERQCGNERERRDSNHLVAESMLKRCR